MVFEVAFSEFSVFDVKGKFNSICRNIVKSKCKTFNSWNNGSVGWLRFLN